LDQTGYKTYAKKYKQFPFLSFTFNLSKALKHLGDEKRHNSSEHI
jgi:hypothetical protein